MGVAIVDHPEHLRSTQSPRRTGFVHHIGCKVPAIWRTPYDACCLPFALVSYPCRLAWAGRAGDPACRSDDLHSFRPGDRVADGAGFDCSETATDKCSGRARMTLGDMVDGAVQLSTLALDAANVPDPSTTVSRLTDLAAKLIPCTAADIVRVTAVGELRILASSDIGVSELTVQAWQRWPHVPLSPAVHAPLASDNHGSGYPIELRAVCGITTELMFALQVGERHHGYLRFLFQDTTSRTAPIGRLAAAFSVQAAIAIDRAALHMQIAGLQTAITTNRDIAAAVGILMVQRNIDYEGAYQLLRSTSQNGNRKLRDVAAEVLISRQLLPAFRASGTDS